MRKQISYYKWLQYLIAFLLILGVFFRFYNLDFSMYWYDETKTSLRISGYTTEEFVEQVYTGEPATVESLLDTYQTPNETAGWGETFNALAQHPEHSPLYYVLARFWTQLFGSSVTAIRVLSAIIGVLILPFAYWLGRELFDSPLVAWLTAAFIAISPFHVLYAKEAREYGLWTLAILASSATLLQALRVARQNRFLKPNLWKWGTYAGTVAFGLYTHPFSALVFLGHGIYVVLNEGLRGLRHIIAYFFSSSIGLFLFLPWGIVVLNNFSNFVENTISTTVNRPNLHLIWGLNLSRIFFDVNQGTSPLNPLLYLIVILTLFAIYYLCINAPQRTWFFLITLMGVTGLALIGPDVLAGGRRSSITRYAIPCYLGIQYAVSYLLATKITSPRINPRRLTRWRLVIYAIAFVGTLSCVASYTNPVWWNKSHAKHRYDPDVAQIVNQSDRPLVVSDEIPGRILPLAHRLDPEVRLQLTVEPNVPKLPPDIAPVYAYRPSEWLETQLRKTTQTEWKEVQEWLWEIRPASSKAS